MSVMALAMDTGRLEERSPNINHSKVPKVNRAYIDKEMPETFLVLMVSMACGIKEAVVPQAAARPSMVIRFIA